MRLERQKEERLRKEQQLREEKHKQKEENIRKNQQLREEKHIAVSDLVRYVLKATSLDKKDLGVPHLLRKRYRNKKEILRIEERRREGIKHIN